MGKINLEKALLGKPVILRNGLKAYIRTDLSSIEPDKKSESFYPLQGYTIQGDIVRPVYWTTTGFVYGYLDDGFDIVGMWEDYINPKDLPNPVYPVNGDKYFYISENGIECATFYETEDSDTGLAENGQCFRTRKDAEMWLKFMKSKLE